MGWQCITTRLAGSTLSRELRGKLASVLITPQQLGGLTIGSDANDAQIGLGIGIHVLEVFASACDDENLADDGGGIKAQGDGADDVIITLASEIFCCINYMFRCESKDFQQRPGGARVAELVIDADASDRGGQLLA